MARDMQAGPVSAAIDSATAGWDKVFAGPAWKKIMRNIGDIIGAYWIENFLPLRFDESYALQKLKYNGGADGLPFWQQKRPDAYRRQNGVKTITRQGDKSPHLINDAKKARTRSRVGKRGFVAVVTVPQSHPTQPRTAAAFKTVPMSEQIDLAITAAQAANAMIQAAFNSLGRKKSARRGRPPSKPITSHLHKLGKAFARVSLPTAHIPLLAAQHARNVAENESMQKTLRSNRYMQNVQQYERTVRARAAAYARWDRRRYQQSERMS